ncbi:MAG: hypothetical protein ACRDF4_00750 [Rhabdochlamydiaceae bacterium]
MVREKRANASDSASSSGYSERKITQLRELKTLFWGLEQDEGIRFVADVPGYDKGAFVFLTKFDDRFCINFKERVFEESSKEFVPGGKEQWKYFETPETAWNYVNKYLKSPLEAYYY